MALLEPFIDTIVICSMTGLVVLVTGVWNEPVPTQLALSSGDITYESRLSSETVVTTIKVQNGSPDIDSTVQLAWHDVAVDRFFLDPDHRDPFTGVIEIENQVAVAADGETYEQLYGMAVENGAPLTALAFQRGLAPLGPWGTTSLFSRFCCLPSPQPSHGVTTETGAQTICWEPGHPAL